MRASTFFRWLVLPSAAVGLGLLLHASSVEREWRLAAAEGLDPTTGLVALERLIAAGLLPLAAACELMGQGLERRRRWMWSTAIGLLVAEGAGVAAYLYLALR